MPLTREKGFSARIRLRMRVLIAAWGCLLYPSFAKATACDHLTTLTIPNTEVSSATAVSAGTFSPAATNDQGGGASLLVPAFCRVLAVAKPTPDSEIHIEIWLPATGAWNGRFLGTGNGGYSSALIYRQMANALEQGYAAAGSDTGHSGGDLKFAVGHAEKINDWAYRSGQHRRFPFDGKVDRTRLLCPWPQVAKWKGSGSTDDAASFACTNQTDQHP